MLRVAAIVVAMTLNLAVWGTLVLLGGLVKLVTFGAMRHRALLAALWFAERWVATNGRIFDTFLDTRWEVEGVESLRPDGHYLVISNHVSWVDIFAVQRTLLRRAPFIRFFIKHTLVWFPIAGQAMWTLDFPLMRRYSAEYLQQHPEKRGRDLETTREACRRYRGVPVSILNYVEGTRFTREKHAAQQSPYRYLLRPRIGGIGFVLASFSEQLDGLLDVTLIYPKADVTMLDLVANRLPWIRVVVRPIEVPREFCTDAITQPGEEREHFKQWVETIWRDKDAAIARVLEAKE